VLAGAPEFVRCFTFVAAAFGVVIRS